jgi:hypothetical protein
MVTTRTQVERLLRIFDQATPAEEDEGLHWYPARLNTGHKWADSYGYPIETCMGVLAATSQRNGWPVNANWTERILRQGYADGGMDKVVRKCNLILEGDHPMEVLGGKKVRSHYLNFMGDTEEVTVDRHMFDIMAGEVTDDRTRKQLARSGEYERHVEIVRTAARRRGVAPRTMQATPWVVWRRLIKGG